MDIEYHGRYFSFDLENCPETADFFEHAKNEINTMSPVRLVSLFWKFDKGRKLPRELFEFIVWLYEMIIDSENDNDLKAGAMLDLGSLYYDGRGIGQDFTKAVYYYEEAAKLGSEDALENLGYCYYYGRDIPVDYEKAFQCFASGAFVGKLISLYKIGDMYRNGYYVDKNPEKAFEIYSRCIDLMTDSEKWYIAGPVYLRLAKAHLYGEGTDKDPHEALECFQKAEHFLREMLEDGDVMYMNSLQAAIDGQDKARQELAENLPSLIWES